MMKNFESRHKDLNQGEDVRNPQTLISAKEKKLKQKMNSLSKEDRKVVGRPASSEKYVGGGRSFTQKAKNKIVAGMRPTRAKQIIKGQGRGGDYAGKSRGRGGGRGGRGGKR